MIIYLLFPHLTGFFICRLYPWVLLVLLLAFLTFDIQLGKGTFFFSSFEKHYQSEPGFHVLWPRFQKRRVEPQFGLKMALTSLHWVPSLPQKANQFCWCYGDSAAGLKDQQAWHQGVWVLLPCPCGTWVSRPSPWASASSDTGAVWTWWAETSCHSRDVFWPSDVLFYYLPSSQSLEAGWIFSFFRWANRSSGILTWVESEDG